MANCLLPCMTPVLPRCLQAAPRSADGRYIMTDTESNSCPSGHTALDQQDQERVHGSIYFWEAVLRPPLDYGGGVLCSFE